MAQELAFNPGGFGVTAFTVDPDGNIVGSSNPFIWSGFGASTGGGGSGGYTVFGINPTYVCKSTSTNRTATQLYIYRLLDSTVYDNPEIVRPIPFDQNYMSKKSTITDDEYDDVIALAAARNANWVGGNSHRSVKSARLSTLYQPAFAGVYDNRSPLEKATIQGATVQSYVTASAFFYHIPGSNDLYGTLLDDLRAASLAALNQTGQQANVMVPSPSWDGLSREPLHPNGPGNYYPYTRIDTGTTTAGLVFDIEVEPRGLVDLLPRVAVSAESLGYWFGHYPPLPQDINGPDDIVNLVRVSQPGDPIYDLDGNLVPSPGFTITNKQEDRRDPSYLAIKIYQTKVTRDNLSQHELQEFLRTGNGGTPFLPSTPPDGTVSAKRTQTPNNYTYNWSSFTSNAAVQNKAPRVKVTAKMRQSATDSSIYTKGTYSHVEVPRVYTTGDEHTPSVIICHDTKKIYYFLYSYQDNKTCVAYNVIAECEEDDKRSYIVLPPSSPFLNQQTGAQPSPPPPPPSPTAPTTGPPTPNPVFNPTGPNLSNQLPPNSTKFLTTLQ